VTGVDASADMESMLVRFAFMFFISFWPARGVAVVWEGKGDGISLTSMQPVFHFILAEVLTLLRAAVALRVEAAGLTWGEGLAWTARVATKKEATKVEAESILNVGIIGERGCRFIWML
jgi:hypothetical protein